MIYFILTTFFISLLSIIFMIWRKLVLLKNGQYEIPTETSFEVPYLKEARNLTIRNIKKYEHISLVLLVKFYIQLSDFLKNQYKELNIRVQNIHTRNHSTARLREKVESSKFFKLISVYKHKIKEITHKIKEGEKDL